MNYSRPYYWCHTNYYQPCHSGWGLSGMHSRRNNNYSWPFNCVTVVPAARCHSWAWPNSSKHHHYAHNCASCHLPGGGKEDTLEIVVMEAPPSFFLSFFPLYWTPYCLPLSSCDLSNCQQSCDCQALSGSSSLRQTHNKPHNCQVLSGSFQPHSRPLAFLS